jgi:hypothetical protein
MGRVCWWWNGKWGRLARRDVEIHYTPESWSVIARLGGAEGKAHQYPAASKQDAEQTAARFMKTQERWRQMD